VREAMGPSFKLPSDHTMQEIEAYVNRFDTSRFDPLDKPLDALRLDSSQPIQNGLPSPMFNHADDLSSPTTPASLTNSSMIQASPQQQMFESDPPPNPTPSSDLAASSSLQITASDKILSDESGSVSVSVTQPRKASLVTDDVSINQQQSNL